MTSAYEEELQRMLKRLVRLFPVIGSLFNLERFIATVAGDIARKAEAARGRPADILIRAKRWLWSLVLDDILAHPRDPVIERSKRLLDLIHQASTLPRYQGHGKYDPRLVAVEYDLLRELLAPLLKRRPGPPRHKIPAVTRGPRSGTERRLRAIERARRVARWEVARQETANRILSVPWWRKDRVFWFDDAELSTLTPRRAALTVLARNTDRSPDAVWDDVKEGRALLPQDTLMGIEEAWKTHSHAPEVCLVLGCGGAPPR